MYPVYNIIENIEIFCNREEYEFKREKHVINDF
jgi:hypothetical protein